MVALPPASPPPWYAMYSPWCQPSLEKEGCWKHWNLLATVGCPLLDKTLHILSHLPRARALLSCSWKSER